MLMIPAAGGASLQLKTKLYSNETSISILFTNRNVYAHASFITIKKQTIY
jgi:hypothetical protein